MPARTSALLAPRKMVALLLTLIAGLAAQAAAAAGFTIAVSRSPLSLPIYVAQEEGFFADEGLGVRLEPCIGGHRCMRQVIDGRAHLATVADVPIALNAFESDNWSVLTTFVSSHDDLKLVARSGSGGVPNVAQLAQRRVGVVPASSSQYFLESFLLTHQIDPATVQAVPLQPEGLVAALTEGRVDAIAAWEPFAHAALRALKGSAAVLPSNLAYRETFNLVVERRLVRAADADLARLLRALERAIDLIHDEPARAQAVLRGALQVDAAFVDWIWPQLQFGLSLDPGLLKTLESEARWALREGHVAGKPPPNYLRYFHAAPLMSVKPELAGIAR